MSGPPVSIGCSVVVTPGAAGPPDSGVIAVIPQTVLTADGLPLAVAGAVCQMVNAVSGVPYPLALGAAGASSGVDVAGQALVRVGDRIPAGSGVVLVLGPPAAPFVTDANAP